MRVGLFSTLTGPGSRDLVDTVATASAAGSLGAVEVAFLFVDREAGESSRTDASVDALQARHPSMPVRRTSAAGFEAGDRKAARAAARAGNEEPLWAWRDAFYASHRHLLVPTDLDLLLGDMWIWGAAACAERRGLNLHPALPGGPAGVMWYEVIWDLVAEGAAESGVMTHRVTTDVDLGPVATFCRYPLRDDDLDAMWATLPQDAAERAALIDRERARKRNADAPLFHALRERGLRREAPLILETVRAVAGGRLALTRGGVVDAAGNRLPKGLDLTAEVEQALR